MAGKLIITPVETKAERNAFINFAWKVYQNDSYWVPPLLSEQKELLTTHPFHEHATIRYFLARREGEVVGRIAAFVNYGHNEHWDEQIGFFGLFEVLDDQEAAFKLLETAEEFVRAEGMTAIRGPMNLSANEECGLLVEGWNGPPVIMLTYNPRYYVNFIEGAGYGKAMDLLAYMVDLTQYQPDGTGVNAKLLRVAEKVRQHYDIKVRPIDMRNFDEEAERIKEVYNAAWSQNWGFVPLTNTEMEHFAVGLKQLLDPKTIFIAEKDGEPIAFMLPFPDLNQPLLRAYPRPGVPEWWTMLKMLYWWKLRHTVTTIRGAVGGVKAQYRGRGVDAVLFLTTMLASIRQGYTQSEISWVLETNIPMRQTAENIGGEVYRTYRIYEKKL